ncbi:hypothetical protein EVAR_61118_1 [Eumeta japonica]|uniref:Uncharacterized protein n=1 Tax=Eumeta variegata TaxID=151549 RepID=A0A4C1ZHM9_EUMVA|nr:hypothetical protein EVAR_61118_1 [Eumeta japonica]
MRIGKSHTEKLNIYCELDWEVCTKSTLVSSHKKNSFTDKCNEGADADSGRMRAHVHRARPPSSARAARSRTSPLAAAYVHSLHEISVRLASAASPGGAYPANWRPFSRRGRALHVRHFGFPAALFACVCAR